MDMVKEFTCLERNEIVYHKIIDCDEDYQETLQQYSDDIFRIVKCESKSSVLSITTDTDKICINGRTEIYISYYNENNELCYADFDREFTKKISIDNLTNTAFVSVVPRDRYTNFRVVNQRRIDVHISLGLETKVFDKHNTPCVSSCNNARLKNNELNTVDITYATQSKIEFDEDFDIPNASASIKRVISHSSNATIKEYKIIKDKVLFKTELSVCALYSTDDDCVERVEHTFAMSKIIDITGINEDDIIIPNISVGSIFLKAKNVNSDTINSIETYGDICLYITLVKSVKKTVVSDGYMIGRKSNCSYSHHHCITASKLLNDSVSDNLLFKFNTEFTEIIDFSVSIHNVFLISNKINVKLVAKIFCKTVDNGYAYLSAENTLYISAEEYKNHLSGIYIDSMDYNIESSNSLNARITLNTNILLYNETTINVLSNIDETDDNIHYPAMTLYFGKKSESIWQIAKQFSSDIDSIKSENNLLSDNLDTNKVLIIPGI